MLSATPSTGKTTYAYDKENRLTKINKNTPLTYDANGNLLSKKVSNNVVAAYTWDYDNMLTGATISGTSYAYAYDPLGQRVKRVAGGVETRYITAGGTVLAEMDASNNIPAYYVYGMGLISKVTPQGAAYYYHYDNLGSTVAMTDSSGNIVNKYAYDPYGKVLSQVEGISNPFKYVGAFGVMDEGNGLLYMRARYYDPATGRFISKDPIGWAGGFNLYAYTGNNPVNWVDPSGLVDEWGFGGIFGPFNFSWNSSQPNKTQVSVVTDIEVGGGFVFCYDNPFKDEFEQRGIYKLPFELNIGLGKYTGISTDNDKMCIGVGLSAGFLPVDISIPVSTQ